MSVRDEIKRKSGCKFQPANAAGLQQLRAPGAPEDLWAFFSASEPAGLVEINKVRRWPISVVFEENTDAGPGSDAQAGGYAASATTIYGDAFSFDTRTSGAPVVLIAHDLETDKGRVTREDLAPLARPTARNFGELLRESAAETLDIAPLYPKRDG